MSDFFKKNRDEIFKPVVVLFVICFVIALALGAANLVTAPKIAALTEQQQQEAMQELVPADSFEERDGKSADGEFAYYAAMKGDVVCGYVFTVASKGYGGEVSVMTALDGDGKVIAVKVLDATSETPGLGQNTTKAEFSKQYAGKTGGISVVKNGADEANNEINAVTGATISSRAVTAAVNLAIKNFDEIRGVQSDEE